MATIIIRWPQTKEHYFVEKSRKILNFNDSVLETITGKRFLSFKLHIFSPRDGVIGPVQARKIVFTKSLVTQVMTRAVKV